MTNNTSPEVFEDDIDLTQVFRAVYQGRKLIMISAFAGLFLGIASYFILPDKYAGYASYIIPETKSSSGFSDMSSFGGGSYLDLFSGKGANKTQANMKIVFTSRRLKENLATNVARKIQGKPWAPFKESDAPLLKRQKTSAYIDFERLELVNTDKGDRFEFMHVNPEMIPIVLTATIEEMSQLNHELDLNVNSKVFEVLDFPITPKSPASPNLIKCIVFGVLGGFLVAAIIIGLRVVLKLCDWKTLASTLEE